MTFTIETLARCLADHLADDFPDVRFLQDPAQQGFTCPCMFLQVTNTKTQDVLAGRILRTIGLDLTYLVDYNLPDMQRRYMAAQELLDCNIRYIPYTDEPGAETVKLHTFNRSCDIDNDGLHYKFELRVFSTPVVNEDPMEKLTIRQDVSGSIFLTVEAGDG